MPFDNNLGVFITYILMIVFSAFLILHKKMSPFNILLPLLLNWIGFIFLLICYTFYPTKKP